MRDYVPFFSARGLIGRGAVVLMALGALESFGGFRSLPAGLLEIGLAIAAVLPALDWQRLSVSRRLVLLLCPAPLLLLGLARLARVVDHSFVIQLAALVLAAPALVVGFRSAKPTPPPNTALEQTKAGPADRDALP